MSAASSDVEVVDVLLDLFHQAVTAHNYATQGSGEQWNGEVTYVVGPPTHPQPITSNPRVLDAVAQCPGVTVAWSAK